MSGDSLIEIERKAKTFIMHLICNGSQVLDKGEYQDSIINGLPEWYDSQKFQRGQQYFQDNRFGVMVSNLFGLITVLTDPKSMKVLASTAKSSTCMGAEKRMISTQMHTMTWYEGELKPGSRSWKSLTTVRHMHLHASKLASKTVGYISQLEYAVTGFGFMGFSIVRPEILGIQKNPKANREGFIHFWAVIFYMLGIKDEFNMCLHPLELSEMILKIFHQCFVKPISKQNSETFVVLSHAFHGALKKFVPFVTYKTLMFLHKRIAGISGYQLPSDLQCKNNNIIFSETEIDILKNHLKLNLEYKDLYNYIFGSQGEFCKNRPIEQFKTAEQKKRIYLEYDNLNFYDKIMTSTLAWFMSLADNPMGKIFTELFSDCFMYLLKKSIK